MQIVGPHHASASEAFPAAAGVADRQATGGHYQGSPGAGVEGQQQWQPPEPAPVDPHDAASPGKRKVPWEGTQPQYFLGMAYPCTHCDNPLVAQCDCQ